MVTERFGNKMHTITSDDMEFPLGVFPDIVKYARDEFDLIVKIELETPYGWREAMDGEPLWTEGMRWRVSFFHYEAYLIPEGMTRDGIIW